MIQIFEEKCINCGMCARVCPFTVIGMEADRPKLIDGDACIHCGHCSAACPSDAVSVDGDFGKLFVPLERNDMYEVLCNFVQGSRSIRNFKQEPMDTFLLQEVLDQMEWAPSARNLHPTKWVVVNGKEKVHQVMALILDWLKAVQPDSEVLQEREEGNDVVTCGASTLLIAYGSKDAVNALTDSVISLSYVDLLLRSKGVGSCWAGYLRRFVNANPEVKAFLKIPPEDEVCGALMLGYPEGEVYTKLPKRKKAEIHYL